MEYDENKKIKRGYCILWIFIAVVLTASICNILQNTKLSSFSEDHQQFKYQNIVSVWNKQVMNSNVPQKYRLDYSDNHKVITSLNNYIEPFIDINTTDLVKYDSLLKTKDFIYLPIQKYKDFLNGNHINYDIKFADVMNNDRIESELKKLSGEKHINIDMIKKIIMMNDFSFFFNQNIEKWQVQDGYTKNVKSYNDFQKILDR